MGHCIELDTAQSVKDSESIDVFDVILQASGWDEARRGRCAKAMWAEFSHRGFGNTDRAYWMSRMKYRVQTIEGRYTEVFDVYDAYLESDYTDLSDGSSEVTYEHEDTPNTVAATDSTRYLSSRDTTRAKSFSGLPATTLRDDLDAVKDPYRTFALEFTDMFCGRLW